MISACAAAAEAGQPASAPPRWLPESERDLSACVVGVEPENSQYFLLPTLSDPPSALPGFDDVRRQVFWLDLELSHGALLQALSRSAQLYVALPAPVGQGSRREEEGWFQDYLVQRCGWDPADLAPRLHFFSVPETLIWSQDETVLLGEDASGRRVLALDPDSRSFYRGFVEGLAGAYPQRFTVRRLPPNVSDEGGDLAVVRRPDGALGLVIGRHRVLDWLQRSGAGAFVGRAVPPALLKKAERAYARAYGLPVQVLPEAPLLQGWGSEDLFHLDMLAAFLAVSGRAVAVVPSFQAHSRDSLTNQPFGVEQTRDWKRGMDQVAKELLRAGYGVERAPLADHPVRSPANSVRFDPGDGGPVQVLLSRYPDQSPGAAPSIGALQYQVSLAQFRDAGDRWNQAPGPASLPALQAALKKLWLGLGRCRALGNPVADAQAQAYQALGCRVQSVDDYPWGAGGFHCQFLH